MPLLIFSSVNVFPLGVNPLSFQSVRFIHCSPRCAIAVFIFTVVHSMNVYDDDLVKLSFWFGM